MSDCDVEKMDSLQDMPDEFKPATVSESPGAAGYILRRRTMAIKNCSGMVYKGKRRSGLMTDIYKCKHGFIVNPGCWEDKGVSVPVCCNDNLCEKLYPKTGQPKI